MARFHQDGIPGPTRPIEIDWSVQLGAHSWNVEAISLMAQICLEELLEDPATVEECNKRDLTITHYRVQKAMKRKLNKIGREIRRVAENGADALKQHEEAVKTKDRRTTRRNTVRYCCISFTHGKLNSPFPQMYKRRLRIIQENKHRDPILWCRIEKVLTTIGIQGMSGDETDATPRRIKEMRRLKHPWLNPGITELWVALDSYEDAINDELLIKIRHRRGNVGLPRTNGIRQDSSIAAPRRLPRNWYADDWWRTLTEGAQRAVAAKESIGIPTMTARSS